MNIYPCRNTNGNIRGASHLHGRWRGTAFTLVELLVVIAIIAMLVAIIVPSFRQVREHGYLAKCQSYMHQLVNDALSQGAVASIEGGETSKSFAYAAQLACPKSEGCPPPPDVSQKNGPESNNEVLIFTEQTNYTLPSSVTVDITEPGTYDSERQNSPGYFGRTRDTIPAGRNVDCYFVHFNPKRGSPGILTNGVFRAPAEIIGIIVTTSALSNSDRVLGSEGTLYTTGTAYRGYETFWINNGTPRQERITLKDDRRTVVFDQLDVTGDSEDTRIITKPANMEGAFPSYAVNSAASTNIPRPRQIKLVEYKKPSIYFDDYFNANMPFDEYIAPRHFGKANVAFMDGSVKLMNPDKINFDHPNHEKRDKIIERYWAP